MFHQAEIIRGLVTEEGGRGGGGGSALGVVKTSNSCHCHDVYAQLRTPTQEALGCRGILEVCFVSIGIGGKRQRWAKRIG